MRSSNGIIVVELNTLVQVLTERGGIATVTMLDKAVADIVKKTNVRQARTGISLSTIIQGIAHRGGATGSQSRLGPGRHGVFARHLSAGAQHRKWGGDVSRSNNSGG